MNNFAVYSDSSCDLPEALIKQREINIVPMKISFDRKTRLTDNVDITVGGFYERLKTSELVPKTYFPTVRDFVDAFKKTLERGQDVLCLAISSKLSKAYHNAANAADILSYIYKDRKIIAIDTLQATAAHASLILGAAGLRDRGVEISAARDILERAKKSAVTIFTLSSLEQLAKGGRMSAATATFGKLLRINPIIYIEDGALEAKSKAIGRKKAIDKLKKLVIKEIGGNAGDYDFVVFHSRSPEEAQELESDLKLEYGIKTICKPIEIGATIGSHTGATAVAVSCVKKITA